MNSGKTVFNKAILLIIAAIFFYALILILSDINKVILVLNQIEFQRYFLILLLSILTIIIHGWRYHAILNKLNLKLNFRESLLISTAGISMIVTPGGIGSIIKSYFLKKRTGRSISSTTPIIIYERWLDIVALTIIIGTLLIWNNFFESQIIFIVSLVLSGFIFFVFKGTIGLNFFNQMMIKTRILRKFVVDVDEFHESTKKLTTLKNTVELLLITFLSKIVPMFAVFLVFDLFNLNMDLFTTSQIYFTSQIIGLLSFIPGGIIVTEAGLLGLILKTGTDFSVATILVFLIRILTFWFPTFIGFLALKFVLAKH